MNKPRQKPRSIMSIVFLAALLCSGLAAGQAGQQETDIVIAKRLTLPSKIFNRDIPLSIALPPGYEAGAAKYPVLYDLNAFAIFTHDVGAVEFLSGLSCMPRMIVVGLPMLPADYVPTPYEDRDGTPKATDLSLKFFREELMPFIDGKYRTCGYNVLSGHSVGGLFTMYALFTQPDLFSAAIASSPWFQAQDQYWLKHVDQMFQADSLAHKSLFMTVGKRERDLTKSTFTELEKWMKAKDLKGLTWKSVWFDDVDHMSMLGKSLYDGLVFTFDGWQIPFDLLWSADVPAIEAYADKVRARFGGLLDYQVPEDLLADWASRLTANKSYDQAAALLGLSAKLYPHSWRNYFSLGDIYAAKGDKGSAAKNYELAVQKNPGRTEPEKILLQVAKAKLNPAAPTAKQLKLYPGDYGVRKVFLEKGVLSYQRSGPKYRLIPLSETLFALEGYENFWLEFVVVDGKAASVIGLYADGRREPSERVK